MRRPLRTVVIGSLVALAMIAGAVTTELGLGSQAGAAEESTTTTQLKSTTTTKGPASSTTIPSGTTTTTIRSQRSAYLDRSTPGVYIDEIAGFGESFVQVATGVPVIIGVGPNPEAAPVLVESLSDFQTLVPNSSPTLSTAVEQFFSNGGAGAYIKGSSGTTAASIIAALGAGVPQGADLVVSADLFSLSGSDWLSVAQMMGQRASEAFAIALIDPPSTTVAEAQAAGGSLAPLTSLGSQLRSAAGAFADSMMLFASNLVEIGGTTVPVSPSFAGVIAQTDQDEGFWNAPNGFANTFPAQRPQFAVNRSQAGELTVAGFDPLMYFPSRGTAVMSDRLLSGMDSWLSVKRTLDTIQQTITNGMVGYIFAANDATTWSAVSSATSSYLQTLFAEGALQGSSAADAYSVSCGLGSTMTDQDILNGYMNLSVDVAVEHPGMFDRITLTQKMAT